MKIKMSNRMIDEGKKAQIIFDEINRQFRCHVAFSHNKAKTIGWIAKSCVKLSDPEKCKDEIRAIVGNQFLREHPIPEDLHCYDIYDFIAKKATMNY